MRNIFFFLALFSGVNLVAGCHSVNTAPDYERRNAYALIKALGARSDPVPKEMVATSRFRTPDTLAGNDNEPTTASTEAVNQLANLRFIGR